MATITLQEIRSRALAFSKEWADGHREIAESKFFWKDFFLVFGLNARRIGTFERAVPKLNDQTGYIDFFWPGMMIVEHKSKGGDLARAFDQAAGYAAGLKDHELPKFILVSDFRRIKVYDLEDPDGDFEFNTSDLSKYIGQFSWIAGFKKPKTTHARNPVDIKAAEKLGLLHDLLDGSKYRGHQLEILMVRLLFCLFADNTGIFEPGLFREFIDTQTAEDGSDLGSKLGALFDVLDQPESERQSTLDDSLAAFPYANGKLFKESIRMPAMTRPMRNMLLDATKLDWSEISPAILGNIFQSIKDKDERRLGGEHYTSEENILKVVNGLFLESLKTEFVACQNSVKKLTAFHQKLGALRFMDPACGCGNFLVVAYRELKALELEVLQQIHTLEPKVVSLILQGHVEVTIDKFYGIELEEFPAQIAQVAMWLVDHQMNQKLSAFVGDLIVNIPLTVSATIHNRNALRMDWAPIISTGLSTGGNVSQIYILGNPPFIGSKQLSKDQKSDIAAIFGKTKNAGILDYVACWYRKAVDYLDEVGPDKVRCAFVSTSSITQGEQVSALWGPLLSRGIHIDFAHRTFHWSNEGKNKAAVHCVIVGFSKQNVAKRELFDYPDIKGEPHRVVAKNINPYLIDADDILVQSRFRPICKSPSLKIGNKPIDDGNYIFTDKEKAEFLSGGGGQFRCRKVHAPIPRLRRIHQWNQALDSFAESRGT